MQLLLLIRVNAHAANEGWMPKSLAGQVPPTQIWVSTTPYISLPTSTPAMSPT